MEFGRAADEGGTAQTWVDRNLPICPLCRAGALLETTAEMDSLSLERWRFRCRNCMAVFSTPAENTVSTSLPRVAVIGRTTAKSVRIESAGSNAVSDVVGKEFSLSELQEWADGTD